MATPAARAEDNQVVPHRAIRLGNRPSVLVIDDETNFCRVLEAKLGRSGFATVTAPDVATGLQWLVTRNFDLILLDIRLPDANALTVLPDLRAAAGTTPFLLMTAYEEEGLRARALLAGAADILYKPFDLDALVGVAQRLIERGTRFTALHIGQAVVLKRTSGRDRTEVDARVARKSADSFAVATGRRVEGSPGDRVEVQLPGEDGIYAFRTTVMGRDREDRLLLAKPDVIRRHQRRERSRATLAVPVAIQLQPSAPGESVTGVTTDISVGGVALVADRPLPMRATVALRFTLPTRDRKAAPAIEAAGEVVRSLRADSGDARVFRIVIRFARLADRDSDRVQAFISHASTA